MVSTRRTRSPAKTAATATAKATAASPAASKAVRRPAAKATPAPAARAAAKPTPASARKVAEPPPESDSDDDDDDDDDDDEEEEEEEQQQQQQQQQASRRRSSLQGAATSTSSSSGAAPSSPVKSEPGSSGAQGAGGGVMLADAADRWEKWRVRSISTLLMLGGFTLVIALGHVAVAGLVIFIQGVIFGEIVGLRYKRMEQHKIPIFRFLTWYFYVACVFYGYGKAFKEVAPQWTKPYFQYHDFASFVLYGGGIVIFVLNLTQGLYRRQFAQLGWTLIVLLMVVVQSTLMINNIFGGLIWFLLPVLCVITNDIMAFIFGFFWGRTPLIQLSPKKTWEGFIGGLFSTVFISFLLAGFMSQFDMFICPLREFAWRSIPHCTPSPAFRPTLWHTPQLVEMLLHKITGADWTTFTMRPIQLHALAFSLFASLVAPFGGFFASGFKRAFRIKDFGDSIPGHGGLTDRMDCQILMALFVYVYYNTFVAPTETLHTVASITAAALLLSRAEQAEIVKALTKSIAN